MTATAILLHDAEAALRLATAGELSLLESAVVAWLRAEPAPSAVAGALSAPLRQYEHVTLACLAEAAGWAVDKANLDDGLRWLVEVALERAGVPAPVVSDGLAHVVLGLAARERPWLASWHDQVLTRGAESAAPMWLGGSGRIGRGSADAGSVELRLALAARGVIASSEADATVLLKRLKTGELPADAFHAQVLLAALDWARRAAPLVLPGQATVAGVADMLRAVPRALQQWPWEDEATKAKALSEWASEAGLGRETLRKRLDGGMSMAEALAKPVTKGGRPPSAQPSEAAAQKRAERARKAEPKPDPAPKRRPIADAVKLGMKLGKSNERAQPNARARAAGDDVRELLAALSPAELLTRLGYAVEDAGIVPAGRLLLVRGAV